MRKPVKKLLCVLTALAVALVGSFTTAFAAENDDAIFENLQLGTKKNFAFKKDADDNLNDCYYKIAIPENGKYKMYVYSSYHKDANEDFGTGLYRSAAEIEYYDDPIEPYSYRIPNNQIPGFKIYDLKAGTYYISVHAEDENNLNGSIMISKATEDDFWISSVDEGGSFFEGVNDIDCIVYKDIGNGEAKYAKTISVTSSNKKVIAVKKSKDYDEKGKLFYNYSLVLKKAGTSKITVKYKRPNGKQYKITSTVRVKKYPAHITSLKVNGKTVNTRKNKYRYEVRKYKGTSPKIKMKLKKGWEITEVGVNYYKKSGYDKEVSYNVKKVLQGDSLKFDKKYKVMQAYIYMRSKNDETITYEVWLQR